MIFERIVERALAINFGNVGDICDVRSNLQENEIREQSNLGNVPQHSNRRISLPRGEDFPQREMLTKWHSAHPVRLCFDSPNSVVCQQFASSA